MKRPYIVCHMVASIDGRIDCSMVDKISGDEYYETLEKLDCPTQLEGRVTMEHYSALKEPFIANDPTPFGMTSVYKAVDSDEVSLLLAPGIDGRKGQTALFDGIADMNRMPVKLSLESVERMENDTLWIRYKTNYK